MDLVRSVYSRDLKIARMLAMDAGAATGEIARKYQLSPKFRSASAESGVQKGNWRFPALGRRGAGQPALNDARHIAEPAQNRDGQSGEDLHRFIARFL